MKRVVNFFDLTQEELANLCVEVGAKKFNAQQMFEWVYQKQVYDFKQMTNIAKNSIPLLANVLEIKPFKVIKTLIDPEDETTKFLFQLNDGEFIETVLMKFNWGYSVCISSEIGCAMGCKFCASGQLKLKRKLTAGEIVLQYVMANDYLMKLKNIKVGNIVVMGIGEPFDNYDNLLKAIKIINNPFGIGLGKRKITVSTCGLPDKIIQFAQDQPQANLAISLHAPNDEVRNKLMPINQAYPLNVLFKAIDEYIKITNGRISFEYIMIDNVNDTDECLKQLIKLTKDRLCYVNLIAYNAVDQTNFKCSKRINHFYQELSKYNIKTTLRLERGSKIDAACGQLRARYEK
ncbi:MAG: 23S rRNA (adenine(2503)-C(2))-methyltransferase RlmN [Mycoplasma sp.]